MDEENRRDMKNKRLSDNMVLVCGVGDAVLKKEVVNDYCRHRLDVWYFCFRVSQYRR